MQVIQLGWTNRYANFSKGFGMSKVQDRKRRTSEEDIITSMQLLDELQFVNKNVFKDTCPACFYDTASLLKNLKGQPAVLF